MIDKRSPQASRNSAPSSPRSSPQTARSPQPAPIVPSVGDHHPITLHTPTTRRYCTPDVLADGQPRRPESTEQEAGGACAALQLAPIIARTCTRVTSVSVLGAHKCRGVIGWQGGHVLKPTNKSKATKAAAQPNSHRHTGRDERLCAPTHRQPHRPFCHQPPPSTSSRSHRAHHPPSPRPNSRQRDRHLSAQTDVHATRAPATHAPNPATSGLPRQHPDSISAFANLSTHPLSIAFYRRRFLPFPRRSPHQRSDAPLHTPYAT